MSSHKHKYSSQQPLQPKHQSQQSQQVATQQHTKHSPAASAEAIWESINLSFPPFFTFANLGGNTTNMTNDNYGTVELTEKQKKWTWLHMVMAALGQICCCVCGIPAVILAILSYIDHFRGDFEKFRKRRKHVIILSIAAIVSGVICITVAGFAIEIVRRETTKALITVEDMKALTAGRMAKR